MQDKPTLEDALALMRDLRARCEWDRAQTHDSLRPYLLEETHELDDALRDGEAKAMREELGDVLLQVLFHSVIAEEEGAFDASDVAASLITKMKRRHPHLYGGGEPEPWERMKARARRSIADGLPAGLPALHRAYRLQDRAAGVGFDWTDTEGPAQKVAEELAEVREHLGAGREGSVMLAEENLCRRAGVHPALALDRANDKFVRRFEAMERRAEERGIAMPGAGLDVLDGLWDEVKRSESDAGA
jgi:MazG family protein